MRLRPLLWSLLFFSILSGGTARAGTTTPDPWFRYFSAQGQHADWAGTVRGKDRGSQDSARLAGEGDLIVPVDWGLRSGKDPQAVAGVVRAIREGKAQPAKRELAARVRALEQAHRGGRLYWQVGNEINSRSMARSLGAAGGVSSAGHDDTALIPLYAELLFAPAVEVLRGAGKDLYSDPRRIHIVLGSIANIHRESSREWLRALLAYRIKGTYAPTLAGQRVADLVSVVSVHYAATADDPPWQGIFDAIAEQLQEGDIAAAIWATEELGKRRAASGLGAATAVRVAAAYLARAAERQQTAGQLRCSFYGWTRGAPGTTADEGMQILLAHFGRERVAYLGSLQGEAPGLESRVFGAAAAPGRRLVVLHGRAGEAGSLVSFTLPAPAGGSAAAALRVTGTLLGAQGSTPIDFVARAAADGGTVQYRPSRPVPVGRGETLLLRELP